MTDQTLVDRAVASAIENFSSSSYGSRYDDVDPLISDAIDDAVDKLDVGATAHDIVYSLLNPRIMTYVNNWLTSAAVKGGPIEKALDVLVEPQIDKKRVDKASKRAASVISSSITKVFKDFKASEKAKYEAAVAPERAKRIETQQTTVHKNRNVSIMNADYDVATGLMANVNATGVPFSNVLGKSVKISSPGSSTPDTCVLSIETDLNMGILINVSPPTGRPIQTKTLYLGSNESKTVTFPLEPGTESGICKLSVIALVIMK